MVNDVIRVTGDLQITEEKIYHRLQKFVERGILERINVEGSREVLYAKKNIPLNKS